MTESTAKIKRGLAKASENLGEAMVGINIEDMEKEEFLQDR